MEMGPRGDPAADRGTPCSPCRSGFQLPFCLSHHLREANQLPNGQYPSLLKAKRTTYQITDSPTPCPCCLLLGLVAGGRRMLLPLSWRLCFQGLSGVAPGNPAIPLMVCQVTVCRWKAGCMFSPVRSLPRSILYAHSRAHSSAQPPAFSRFEASRITWPHA